MKNFLSIISFLALATVAMGQSTSPRFIAFGTTDASSIRFGRAVITDAASATLDTVKFYPRSSRIQIDLTVLDSCTLTYNSLAGCYKGDQLDLYVVNPAQTGTLKLLGNFTVSTGTKTISLTANKKILSHWVFDGVNWVEGFRNANY